MSNELYIVFAIFLVPLAWADWRFKKKMRKIDLCIKKIKEGETKKQVENHY